MMNMFNKYTMVLLISVCAGAHAGLMDEETPSISGPEQQNDTSARKDHVKSLREKMFTPKDADKDADKDT
jgi:hypothetical protein